MKKIAIIGTASDSRGLAPYHDKEWEIWACSPGNRRSLPRVDQWFELHGIEDMRGPENNGWRDDYFGWLRDQTFPVWMQEVNDLCPQAKVFPIKSWLKEFGRRGRTNATSSISLMIGFAIMERADEIGIWGVDMADTTEAYTLQKSGCHNMLLIASERGIKVHIPLESCLASLPPLYGYAEASRMGRRMLVRKHAVAEAIDNAQKQMNHWERQLYTLRGMMDQIEYFMRTWVDGEMDAEIAPEDAVEDWKVPIFQGGMQSGLNPSGQGTVTRIPMEGQFAEYMEKNGVFVPKTKGNSGVHAGE